MHHFKFFFALLTASSVLTLPLPQGDCIGSSFSPTNCDSPGAQSIDISPDLNIDPSIGLRDVIVEERDNSGSGSDDDCIGSSFSPTNCNSPGAQSINVDPNVDVSPDINLRDIVVEERDNTGSGSDDDCVGSSFSPTNCNSPGAQSINVDPTVDVSPTVDAGDLLDGVSSLLG